MKKVIYYIVLIILLFICMFGVSYLMVSIEDIFHIQLGTWLMYLGFLVGMGVFFALKSIIDKQLKKRQVSNKLDKME